jgi:hypothetical protein
MNYLDYINEDEGWIKNNLEDWHIEPAEDDRPDLKYRIILSEHKNGMQFSMHSNHYNIGPRPVVIAEFMFDNSKLQTVILNDLAWCLNATSPYDFYTWFRIVGRYIVAYSAHYKSTVAYRQFYSLDDIDRLQRQHMVKKLEKEIEEITSGEALESRVRKLLMIKR